MMISIIAVYIFTQLAPPCLPGNESLHVHVHCMCHSSLAHAVFPVCLVVIRFALLCQPHWSEMRWPPSSSLKKQLLPDQDAVSRMTCDHHLTDARLRARAAGSGGSRLGRAVSARAAFHVARAPKNTSARAARWGLPRPLPSGRELFCSGGAAELQVSLPTGCLERPPLSTAAPQKERCCSTRRPRWFF